jgi:hypothetical protein
MKAMINIPLIAFLLGAFSCSQQEVPIAPIRECRAIIIDDSLYQHTVMISSGFGQLGRIDESVYGPVSIQDGCLFIPILIGMEDLEFRLIWDGKVNDSLANICLFIVNHTPEGTEVISRLKAERLYFDLSPILTEISGHEAIRFQYYDFYKEMEL